MSFQDEIVQALEDLYQKDESEFVAAAHRLIAFFEEQGPKCGLTDADLQMLRAAIARFEDAAEASRISDATLLKSETELEVARVNLFNAINAENPKKSKANRKPRFDD